MALNSNHTFEEINEIKCSIVEKNCSAERTQFLKQLLEHNFFTVVIAKSHPPKTAPKTETVEAVLETTPLLPETFTVGVTDLSFATVNALFNRELKTKENKIVTPNYWKQTELYSNEEAWYWKKGEIL